MDEFYIERLNRNWLSDNYFLYIEYNIMNDRTITQKRGQRKWTRTKEIRQVL